MNGGDFVSELTKEEKAELSRMYRKRKKAQDRILDETKPGTVLRNNPDYKRIMALVKKGE